MMFTLLAQIKRPWEAHKDANDVWLVDPKICDAEARQSCAELLLEGIHNDRRRAVVELLKSEERAREPRLDRTLSLGLNLSQNYESSWIEMMPWCTKAAFIQGARWPSLPSTQASHIAVAPLA
jgi:hypothetical protein